MHIVAAARLRLVPTNSLLLNDYEPHLYTNAISVAIRAE